MRKLSYVKLENTKNETRDLLVYSLDSDEPNVKKLIEVDEDGMMYVPYRGEEYYSRPDIVAYIDRNQKVVVTFIQDQFVRSFIKMLETTDLGGYQVRIIWEDYSYKRFMERVMMINQGYDDRLVYLSLASKLHEVSKHLKKGEEIKFDNGSIYVEDGKYYLHVQTNRKLYEWRFDLREKSKIKLSKAFDAIENNHNYLVDLRWAYQVVAKKNYEPKHRYYAFRNYKVYTLSTSEKEIRCTSILPLVSGLVISINKGGKIFEGKITKVESVNELDAFLDPNLRATLDIKDQDMNVLVDGKSNIGISLDELKTQLKETIFPQFELNHHKLAITGTDIKLPENRYQEIEAGDILESQQDLISHWPMNGRTNNVRVYIIGTRYDTIEVANRDLNVVREYHSNTKFYVIDKYIENNTKVLYLLELNDNSWFYYKKEMHEVVKSMEDEVGTPYGMIEESLNKRRNIRNTKYYLYEDDDDDYYDPDIDDAPNIDMREEFNKSMFVRNGKLARVCSPLKINK